MSESAKKPSGTFRHVEIPFRKTRVASDPPRPIRKIPDSNVLSPEQDQILDKLYNQSGFLMGRDRLWFTVKREYPDSEISQRDVMRWLKHQTIWQKHTRNMIKPGAVAPLLRTEPGYCQIDLVFLPPDHGFMGALTCIDLFTKYCFAKPIRNKSSVEVARAFKQILDDAKRLPKKISVIQSDQGKEFLEPFSTLLKSEGIKQIFSKPHTPQSNSQVERFNGYLKSIIHKAIARGFRWSQNLEQYVKNINQTFNETTKMAPIDLELGDDNKRAEVGERMQASVSKRYGQKQVGSELEVGQTVRILKPKGALEHTSVVGVWSDEVYIIDKVVKSTYANILPSYKIREKDTDKIMKGLYPRYKLLSVVV